MRGNIQISEAEDSCRWMLTKNGIFSITSLYNMLKTQKVHCSFNDLWKYKVPLRVKLVMWLNSQRSILTKDTLSQRGWSGDDRTSERRPSY
jgi:hypothetical protein